MSKEESVMGVEEVQVEIDEKGNPVIHVIGVKGDECRARTEGLEKALGGEVLERKLTHEADQAPVKRKVEQQQRLTQ